MNSAFQIILEASAATIRVVDAALAKLIVVCRVL